MTSESRGELQNAPTQNFNSFNRTDEHSETDVQPALNTSENQGMSLFEMFDACLNSIRQNNNGDKNRLSSLNDRMNGNRREHLSVLLQKSPLSATHNREPSDTKLYEIPESDNEVRESREGLEKATEIKSNTSIDQQVEKEQPDTEEMQRLELRVGKLKRIFERHYLKRWQLASFINYKQNYEEDFDLIHGNIEGIEGFGDLDSSPNITRVQRYPQEDLLVITEDDDKDVISKDFDRENLLSDKLSFCELNLSEGDRYLNFSDNSLAQAHFNLKPKVEAPAAQGAGSNKKVNKKGMSTEFMSSPRIIGKSSAKVSSLRNSLQEKENIKDRKNVSMMKSPKRELPKKELEKSDKPKTGLKPLAAKPMNRGVSIIAKGPVNSKAGLPPSNKEASFAVKATPTKIKKTVLGGNR